MIKYICINSLSAEKIIVHEGRQKSTNGTQNSYRFHQYIRKDCIHVPSSDFKITYENEEIVFPYINSFQATHGKPLKMAFKSMS